MKTGIVFEGGAFRTIFSCGVMDALVENNIMPDYMIGVSAGAAYGVSMASRQPGRNLNVLMKYRNDKRYLGIENMFDKNNRSVYGLEFSYETIPNELNLFDYDSFMAYKGDFYCVVTNILTGQPEYMKYTGKDHTNTVLKATCALPMLFPPIIINDIPYMDGGLTDSIPFKRAFNDGCDKVLVIPVVSSPYDINLRRNISCRNIVRCIYILTGFVICCQGGDGSHGDDHQTSHYTGKKLLCAFTHKTFPPK